MFTQKALVGAAIAVFTLVFACSKSKSDANTEKTDDEKADSKSLLDRGKTFGKRAAAAGKKHGKQLGAKGKQLGDRAVGETKSLATRSVQEVKDIANAVVAMGGKHAGGAAARINVALNSIARDPDAKVSTADKVARLIVLMVPIVGPTKRFADARKLYATAAQSGDETRKQRARREALIAFAEASLDIGTLGLVGSRIDLIATGADKALSALRLSRTAGTLVGANLKAFDGFLDTLLSYSDVQASVDAALQ